MLSDWAPPSVTLLVGILGVGGTFIAGERLRRHGQRLAREQREQDRRATAYVDMLISSERIGNWIWSVHPTRKYGVFLAPDGPSADEQAKTKALLLAYGSDEVRDLFGVWDDAARDAIDLAHRITSLGSRGSVFRRTTTYLITIPKSRGRETKAKQLRGELDDEARPAEKAAREALASRINLELRTGTTKVAR